MVVAKGDLVTPHEQIAKKVKIVHKINPKGKKTGRVQVILSSHDGTGESMNRPDQLLQVPNGTARLSSLLVQDTAQLTFLVVTRKTVQLDYDLGDIPDVGRRDCYKRIIDPQTRRTYDKVEMQLEVTVSIAGDITLDLRAGMIEDHYRSIVREGYRLAHWAKLHSQGGL